MGWHTSHCSLVNTDLTAGPALRPVSISLSEQPDRPREHSAGDHPHVTYPRQCEDGCMTISREWHLTRRPHGVPVDEDFALVDVELPPPDDGEILVRNTFLSVDPYMRGRMNDAKSYVPPFQLGQPMDGAAVGTAEQVGTGAVDSNGAPIAVGDTVLHALGWRTSSLIPARSARVLDTSLAQAQAHLGVLGMPGLTAYAGLLRVAELAEGDRVF